MNNTLTNILLGNQMREKNFQEQNDVSVKDIAAKYPAFNGKTKTIEASCLGMYPGSVFNSDKNDQLNYIDFVNNGKINKSDQIKQLNMRDTHSTKETFMNVGSALMQKPSAPRVLPGNGSRSVMSAMSGGNGNGPAAPGHSSASYGDRLHQERGHDFVFDQNTAVDRNYDMTGNFDTGYADPYTRQNIFANNMKGSLYNISSVTEQPLQDSTQMGIYGGAAAGQYPPNTVVDMDNFINNSNGEASAYLTKIDGRPIVDFTSNNMVPFATKFTQNMAGTGVRSAYDVDGSTFDSGADNSTPHQTKLAAFTGMDDTYMHKREAGPMYSPAEQQMGYVYGAPVIRADLDEYTQTMRYKPDMAPVQAIQVGPGLDIDPSVPANGGFHDFTRVMPNNISDYKANQLEGRINAGKYVTGGELPTSYPGIGVSGDGGSGPGVEKHRPTSFWSQARRPTMTTRTSAPVDANMLRSDYQADFKPRNPLRAQTSYGFGSVTPGKGSQNVAPVPHSYGQMQGKW